MKIHLALITTIVVFLSSATHAGPNDIHKRHQQSVAQPATDSANMCYVIKTRAGSSKPIGLRKKVAVACTATNGKSADKKSFRKRYIKK